MQSELELLKERADTLGLKYSASIGVDALRNKVNASLEPVADIKEKDTEAVERVRQIAEATRLVRVRIMNMNPAKKDWKGEYFTVSNAVVGTIRRYVPYDVEWHCQDFILGMIKDRQMARYYSEKNDKGMSVRRYRLVPEFSVEMLPDLSKKELDALAADQKKRGAIA